LRLFFILTGVRLNSIAERRFHYSDIPISVEASLS
jgi:hypothetical protein